MEKIAEFIVYKFFLPKIKRLQNFKRALYYKDIQDLKDYFIIFSRNELWPTCFFLKRILKELNNNWLLSYNDCEEIGELYEDFRIEEINIKYSISSEKINWASKKELLIKNF